GVLVERDVGAVGTAELLARADDDGLDDLALAHGAVRRRLLDGRRDDVPDAGVPAVRAALDAGAEDLAGARVVGDAEICLVLDHVTSTSPSRGRRAGASAWSATAGATRRRGRRRPRSPRRSRRGRAACSCGGRPSRKSGGGA